MLNTNCTAVRMPYKGKSYTVPSGESPRELIIPPPLPLFYVKVSGLIYTEIKTNFPVVENTLWVLLTFLALFCDDPVRFACLPTNAPLQGVIPRLYIGLRITIGPFPSSISTNCTNDNKIRSIAHQ